MRNAPPPFDAALAGNRRKFPSPMALPAMARTRPIRVAQRSRLTPPAASSAAFFLPKRTRDMQ
jgi:hypothetical protein